MYDQVIYDPVPPTDPRLRGRLPDLTRLPLAGVRRARDRRGSATDPLTMLRVLIRFPQLHAVAAVVPTRGPVTYPTALMLVFAALAHETGSFDDAEVTLDTNWNEARLEWFAATGVTLPEQPLRARAFFSWRDRLVQVGGLAALHDRFTDTSLELADWCGLLQPGVTADWLNLLLAHLVYGDGTWLKPATRVRELSHTDPGHGDFSSVPIGSRARDPRDARVGHRINHDPDKHSRDIGLLHLFTAVRGHDPYSRVILATQVVDVPPDGNAPAEQTVAQAMVLDLHDRAGDRIHAFSYDGAFNLSTLRILQFILGVVLINRNAARTKETALGHRATAPDGDVLPMETRHRVKRTSRLVQRPVHHTELGAFVHQTAHGDCVHELVAVDDDVYEVATDPSGLRGRRRDPLRRVGTERHRVTRHGAARYDWTVTVEIPCRHGAFTEALRIAEPSTKSFPKKAIAALIRLVPDTSPAFRLLYGARNDAEALNSWLKAGYRNERARSMTPEGQALDLLAAALLSNAETWAHEVLRKAVQAAA